MKRTRMNNYSLKKIDEKNAEAPIRIALCKRAGGTPITREVQVYHSGQRHTFTKVECLGGTCECGCGQRADNYTGGLSPHEKHSRGQGGKLSLENSIMVLNSCHSRLQRNEPMWSKND
ncbi:MAG: hypothetical protein PHQ86_04715 [Dehalococcoidales bacterium]|jgi:hypothetical protein|nr:hypothetical protein [Dehalococcoidales bacterium]